MKIPKHLQFANMAAAKRAEHAAAHAEKLLLINIITLMTITAISVAALLLVLL